MFRFSRNNRRYYYSGKPGCTSMMECISKGEGCPMYTKLIVCTLMAILIYMVMEFIGEEMVKNKFQAWGDILVVTPGPDHVPRHEYETRLWVKLMNLAVGLISFAVVWRHLTIF